MRFARWNEIRAHRSPHDKPGEPVRFGSSPGELLAALHSKTQLGPLLEPPRTRASPLRGNERQLVATIEIPDSWIRRMQVGPHLPPLDPPPWPDACSEATAQRWRFRDELRNDQGDKRQRSCGRKPIGTVQLGPGWQRGVETCGSVHSCPVCAGHIRTERARELARAVKVWTDDGGTVGMLTLTVRHSWGDALRRLRSGLAAAWRRLWQGRAGQAGRALFDFYVRAVDVTHGPNGWHPHLHVLIFTRHLGALTGELETIRTRWADCVAASLGETARPRVDEVGVCWSPKCARAEYLLKLGLELNQITTKQGRPGHRNPWQIAQDTQSTEPAIRCQALQLWREWCGAMKGARHLTWSRGCRALARQGEQPEQLQLDFDQERARRWVVSIPARDWAQCIGRPWDMTTPGRLLAASQQSLGAVLVELERAGLEPLRHEIRTLTHDGEVGAHIYMKRREATGERAPPRAADPFPHIKPIHAAERHCYAAAI